MNCCNNCNLKYSPSDGQNVTWSEPTPMKKTSDPNEVFSPAIVQVYKGSSVKLNWSYSLASDLSLGNIKFKDIGIVNINADGSAGPVNAIFRKRFSLNSTVGRASLSISPVTVGDDKYFGEFSCVLIDSSAANWKRAIQVQVLGKFTTVVDYEKAYPNFSLLSPILPSGLSLNAART